MTGTTARGVVLAVAVAGTLAVSAACTASTTVVGPTPAPTRSDGTAAERAARTAALPALRAAERATVSAGSARVESATRLGTMMSMTAKGTLSWDDGLTGALTIDYTGGTMADTMRGLGSTSMPARYLDDAYYARMGDTFAAKAGGKHWIRYGYNELDGAGGGAAAYLGLQDQMRDTTPDQPVKLLLTAPDAHRAGTATVRGRAVTRYSGTVDVARLTTAGSGLSGGQVAELRKLLTQAGVATETVDVWIDADGLLVKKAERGRTAGGTTAQTAYYSGYGVGVSVGRPPAGDTVDFKNLLESQGATGDGG